MNIDELLEKAKESLDKCKGLPCTIQSYHRGQIAAYTQAGKIIKTLEAENQKLKDELKQFEPLVDSL